jgi:hypothetical protein
VTEVVWGAPAEDLVIEIHTVVLTVTGHPCSQEQRVAKRTVQASEVPTSEDEVDVEEPAQ